MLLAALALVLAADTAPAPAAKTTPLIVEVLAAPSSGAGAHAWEKELRAALALRKEEFRLAKPGEKAELSLLVDSLAKGQGDTSVLTGVLTSGKARRPFNLTYTGEIFPQAEKLARGLRKIAEQMRTAPPAK